MKNTKQVIALASAAALSVSVLAGCGGAASDATSESTSTATAEASNTAASDGTLVLAETGFEGKFSPFFASSASDQDVIDLTQLGLLGADRKGEMILNGIEGETREYNGTDYTYYGTSDCVVTENDDGTVTYDIKLRDDLIENSTAKLKKKNMDMIVANNLKVPGAGFGVDTNVVTIITEQGITELPLQSKDGVAGHIADAIANK